MDFMVLVPKRSGPFEVDLVYRKPFSVYLGYIITLTTVGILGFRVFKSYSKRREIKS